MTRVQSTNIIMAVSFVEENHTMPFVAEFRENAKKTWNQFVFKLIMMEIVYFM